MRRFKQFTVGTLIEALSEMSSDAVLSELSEDVDSYRGYYDHVAIAPGSGVTVEALLTTLRSKLGTTMHGYKGGDYSFVETCLVFVGAYGDTGPMLMGFVDGEPVIADESWVW